MERRYYTYVSLHHLWQAVHSLSAGEVKNLREKAARMTNEKPTYLRLYEVLRSFEAFDKRKILESLTEQGIYKTGRVSMLQEYLYYQLRDAMQQARAGIQGDVSDLLLQMRIFLSKGLFEHAQRLIPFVHKFVTQTEAFEDHLKLLDMQKETLRMQQDQGGIGSALQALKQEEQEVWQKRLNLREWDDLYDQRFLVRDAPAAQRPALLHTLKNHPLILNGGPCLSIRAQVRREQVMARIIGIDRPDYREKIVHLERILPLLETKEGLLEDCSMMQAYLATLTELGLLCNLFHEPEKRQSVLTKLEQVCTVWPEYDAAVFERGLLIRFADSTAWARAEDAPALMQEYKKGLSQYHLRIRPVSLYSFAFFAASYNIYLDAPRTTVKVLLPLLHEPLPAGMHEKYCWLWVQFCIAHYDLGNYETVCSAVKTTRRIFRKYDYQDAFLNPFLKLLYDLSKREEEPLRHEKVRMFIQEITPVLNAPENYRVNQSFHFLPWLQSRYEGSDLKALILKAMTA